jgi:hypothetical protein
MMMIRRLSVSRTTEWPQETTRRSLLWMAACFFLGMLGSGRFSSSTLLHGADAFSTTTKSHFKHSFSVAGRHKNERFFGINSGITVGGLISSSIYHQERRQITTNHRLPTSTSTIIFAVNKNDDGDRDPFSTTDNDDDNSSIPSSPLDRPVLALVDTVMILLFAGVGKASHNAVDGSLDIVAVAQTAAPFLLSWLLVAPLLGCFTPMATGDWKQSTLATTKGWIVAVPLGCVLRGIIKGYVPPLPFVIVTMIATWVLLVGGRVLYTAAAEFYVELF